MRVSVYRVKNLSQRGQKIYGNKVAHGEFSPTNLKPPKNKCNWLANRLSSIPYNQGINPSVS